MSNLFRVTCPRNPAEFRTWEALPSLTDVDGELLDENMDAGAYHRLLDDRPLLDKLCAQLPKVVRESTVAQVQGQLGVLLQMAFPCRESDGIGYQPRAVLHGKLLPTLAEIMDSHPQVEAAIPSSDHVFKGRVAAWVFVPDGVLDADGVERLQARIHERCL